MLNYKMLSYWVHVQIQSIHTREPWQLAHFNHWDVTLVMLISTCFNVQGYW